MGGTDRLPLAQAERLALELVAYLGPVTDRVLVAGSIRRRKPDCGDIEVLAIPKYVEVEEVVARDMFGDTLAVVRVSLLDQLCDSLRAQGILKDRSDVGPAWGPSYKRTSFKDFPVDLFISSEEKWACLQAIRTGPVDFTHRMVQPRSTPGGFCPSYLQFKGGRLIHRHTGEPLEGILTEEDVFTALGVVTLPPELRTDEIMPPALAGVRA